jgi:Ca2+-binding EF-hand superfamily protein
MKTLATGMTAAAMVAMLTASASAQPPQRLGGGRPGIPPNPIVTALDADGDGVISAAELKNASAALKKLDKNNDGKISPDEVRPSGRFGGAPGGFGRRPSPAEMITRFDKNSDGKINKNEIPEQMARFLGRADANNDGDITKAELTKMFENFRPGGGRPGGGRPGSGLPGTTSAAAEAGKPAPDFKLKSLDGKREVQLSSFAGKRPVALIFGSYT